jgi:hypothetical protein
MNPTLRNIKQRGHERSRARTTRTLIGNQSLISGDIIPAIRSFDRPLSLHFSLNGRSKKGPRGLRQETAHTLVRSEMTPVILI